MPEDSIINGIRNREFSPEELIQLSKIYRESHEAMHRGSMFEKAPDLMLEAVTYINSLAVTTKNSRGVEDKLYIDLDRTSKNLLYAYRYMLDVAITFQDNKSLRGQNAYMQERINRLEARLVIYEVMETAMNEGTLEETIKIIKAKQEAGL
jgi:hypothetical protein